MNRRTELKRTPMPQRETRLAQGAPLRRRAVRGRSSAPGVVYFGRQESDNPSSGHAADAAPQDATWTDSRGWTYGYVRKDPSRPGRQERRRRAEMGQSWCRGCREWLPTADVSQGACKPCLRLEYKTRPKASIRQLKAGEQVPGMTPRRYKSAAGYIRLRWKVAPMAYVEVYEHRVVDGYVTDAEQVHHKNRNRSDNRVENLEHLTAEEHQAEHAHEARERAAQMAERYKQGRSLPQIGREFGIASSAVYRRLADFGVQMRTNTDYAKPVDTDAIVALYLGGRGYSSISAELQVSTERIKKLLLGAGVTLRPVGRVRGHGPQRGEGRARKLVYARSDGDCEVRLREVCLGHAANWHHRKNRSQGGEWLASNGLHVCGSGTRGCHGALTNTNGHRAEYELAGWIVPFGQDPADVKVLLADGWFLLDNKGAKTPTTAPKAAA